MCEIGKIFFNINTIKEIENKLKKGLEDKKKRGRGKARNAHLILLGRSKFNRCTRLSIQFLERSQERKKKEEENVSEV